MKKVSFKQILIFIILTAFSIGCTMAQVTFPDGTDQAKFVKYQVAGNNSTSTIFDEKYAIGNYKVVVDRSMTSSSSSSKFFKMFGSEKSKTTEQGYSFSIKGPDKSSWKGDCLARVASKDESTRLFGIKVDSKESVTNTLQCFFESSDNKKYEMKMVETGMQEKTGEITGNNLKFSLKSTKKMKGSKFDSEKVTGYYFSSSSGIVAVIDLLNDGAVYIANGVDKNTESLILATSVSLLSYKDMKGTKEKKPVNLRF